MFTVKQLPEFSEWLADIKDGMTRRRLARRLEKAQDGNLGDIKPVGEGVTEMREHFGSGWRMYFVQRVTCLSSCLAVEQMPRNLLTLPNR